MSMNWLLRDRSFRSTAVLYRNVWDTLVHYPHQAGSETQPVEVRSQSDRNRMGLNQTDSGVSSEMFGIGSGFPSAMARARR